MQKLKMIFVGGVLVAITVLSVAGLCFSDDAQPAPERYWWRNNVERHQRAPGPPSAAEHTTCRDNRKLFDNKKGPDFSGPFYFHYHSETTTLPEPSPQALLLRLRVLQGPPRRSRRGLCHCFLYWSRSVPELLLPWGPLSWP